MVESVADMVMVDDEAVTLPTSKMQLEKFDW
jgi:hypothetical protein